MSDDERTIVDDSDPMPPGFAKNSEGDQDRLAQAMAKVWLEIGERENLAEALAVVVVMPDGKVTTALASKSIESMARLMTHGPDNLRITVDRMLAGFGKTTVIRG